MAIMMRDRWSLAIHHEDRREGSLISEKDFIRFADVHATMKSTREGGSWFEFQRRQAQWKFRPSIISETWGT
jgi:hypothetical protein